VTYERMRDTLIDMVDIASPTGREADLAKYIVGRLSKAGCDAYLQDVTPGRPNAIGMLRGTGEGPNLMFTGHMDTSYDGDEDYLVGEGYKAKAIYRDGWVWGLGANNMKSGLAASLVALEALALSGATLKGDIYYGGVVGETEKAAIDEFDSPGTSGYGIGSHHLVTHSLSADFCVLTEPTDLRVCIANMGVLWVKVTITGTVAHAALAHDPRVVNAVEMMNALLPRVKDWSEAYWARTEYMGEKANVTIAAMRGGMPWRLARNPFECSLYLDIRTVPGQRTDDVLRSLRKVLRGFAADTGTPEPRLQLFVNDPPTVIPPDGALASAMHAAHSSVTGARSKDIIRRPGADATHFNRYDVPCVVYGPGGGNHPDAKDKLMHAVGEHASVDKLVTAGRVYVNLALDVCQRDIVVE
jgi:acetylornithine deacetylase